MNLLETVINADLNDLPDIVKECGCNTDASVARLMKNLMLEDDFDLRMILAQRLATGLTQRRLGNPWFASAPNQKAFTGTPHCIFGRCLDSDALYTLSYDDHIRHCYFAGASGFGKTNLMLLQQGITLAGSSRQISGIVPYDAPHHDGVTFLSCESKPAARYWLPYTDNLYVCDTTSYVYSAFQGIKHVDDYRGLIEQRLEIFATETEVRAPSRMLLMDVVMRIARNNGVFHGSTKYPAMIEVLHAVEQLKFLGIDRRSRYRESILVRLGGLLSSCPEVFNCRAGLPIDLIDSVNFSLELPNVSTDVRRLLFSWLLNDLYKYRESAQLKGLM